MSAAGKSYDYLLVDISNSYTKIAFSGQKKVGRSRRVRTCDLRRSDITSILSNRRVNTVVVSSVVPSKTAAVQSAAGAARVILVDPKLKLGVGIDYPKPRTIGGDRLANAAAVAELHGVPAIVVDFGTAVTFDVVSGLREYIGGVIAPGLEAMTNYLYQRTALLPKISLREPSAAIGKTTRAAMLSGAIFGYRGLVKEILRQIRPEVGAGKVAVIATGGYAKLIASRMPVIDAVVEDLTLQGLRIIGNLNR